MQRMFIYFLFFFSVLSNSQTINSITAKVTNSNKELLFGNVLVLSSIDSTFIKGNSFLDGKFLVGNLNNEEIILKLTSLEFEDTFLKVKYKGKAVIDLGVIEVKMRSSLLDEVKIAVKNPTIIQKANGTVEVKVSNTLLSESNSLNEILSKTPGIILDGNSVSIFGKGQAIIYLNGRRITDEQFASIPVSQIDKIEVISNPSAKYEAEGRAVLNIKTKKNSDDGYNGSIKQNTSYSNYAGFNTFTSSDLNYKYGKFSLLGNYSIQSGKDREVLKTTRKREAQNEFFNSNLKTEWNRDLNNYSNYGVGLQYEINDKSYISAEYNGFLEKLGGNQISFNQITTNSGLGLYTSDIKKDNTTYNNSISVNYNSVLDTLGSSLFIGTQYVIYSYNINDLIDEKREESLTSFNVLKNLTNFKIAFSNAQLDFTKAFKNDDMIEIGARISNASNNSVLDFFTSTNGQNFTQVDLLSNSFRYEETIAATYINYKGKWNSKINYSVGLRTETTDYLLIVESEKKLQSIAKNYWNAFPSASLNIKLSDELSLNTSYSSRINRVQYRALNPNLIYQDPFTSIQGNPDLVPEKAHSIEMNTKYKSYSLKIGYDYSTDPINGAALRGSEPNSYVLKGINLKNRNNYFLTISKSFSTDWLTSTNNLSFNYTDLKDDQFNFQILTPQPQLYLYTNTTFKIPNLFNIELLAWYLGEKYSGLYYDRSRWNITIGLEKSFLNKSLKCRLIANDIFHTAFPSGDYNVGETQIYYNRKFNTNYLRLALSYNFGKLTKTTYKKKATGESENSRAK
ncbi:TonB-dependent receptor domain-containing protein [Flavobacterium sp.]|uniref:TonB-dependent receptor domain-containing protein n=1 Tax=Flavobacterium sp. TaxID=239 RepID=UPI00286D7BC3|nr:TonB-dependent receptor [Flavobacterium sp.]